MKKKKAVRPRRVGRPSKESDQSVRGLILDAFLKICQEDGIETVTIQKIANRSQVALTSVRYHFQMQGLSLSQVALDFVAEKNYEFINAYLTEARTKKNFDPVKAYMETQFNWLDSEPLQASFLVYFYYMCTTKRDLTVSNKEIVEIGQRRVLSLIHEGLGMGLYKISGDAETVAIEAHLLLMGACLIAGTCRDVDFARKQKTICMNYVSNLLGTNH